MEFLKTKSRSVFSKLKSSNMTIMGKVFLVIRILLVIFSACTFFNIKRISDIDWRSTDHTNDNPLDFITKRLMTIGCQAPGFRLMCKSPDNKSELFPSEEAGLLDLIVGSFAYSFLFIVALWVLSPLPDVTTNLFLIVSFQPRPRDPLAEGALIPVQAPLLQLMRQGGGEGALGAPIDEVDI